MTDVDPQPEQYFNTPEGTETSAQIYAGEGGTEFPAGGCQLSIGGSANAGTDGGGDDGAVGGGRAEAQAA